MNILKDFKGIKINTTCDRTPSYGLDDISYSWELVLDKKKVKLDGNSCYTDGYVLREKDVRELIGEMNQGIRKRLFSENSYIFYKISDMNHELRQLAMEIPKDKYEELIESRQRILSMIKKYEEDMQEVLNKRTKFSLYRQEF